MAVIQQPIGKIIAHIVMFLETDQITGVTFQFSSLF